MSDLNFPQKHGQIQQKLRFILEERFGEEAYMLERLLLEDFTAKKLVEPEEVIASPNIEGLESKVNRLLHDEPIQYILGKAHFYGRDFTVNPSVLIPRRETEELMVWIREDLKKRKHQAPFRILDIGTGSGCIPISLSLELRELGIEAEVWGMDISEKALTVARDNNQLFEANCQFFTDNILEIDKNKLNKWDIIISNPPYVPQAEKKVIAPRVKEHEPGLALFVPDEDPLRFYKKISELASNCLQPGGHLYFEIHEDFGKEMEELLASIGFDEILLKRDMQGKDRMIKGRKTL